MSGSGLRGVGAPGDWALLMRRARDIAASLLRGQDAEDVAQQSMLELWHHVHAGAEIAKPARLLATILGRRVRNLVMRRQRLMLQANETLDLRASHWAPDPAAELELSDSLDSACGSGIGRSLDLVHEALAGGGPGSHEAAPQAWSPARLTKAQRAYQEKKRIAS